MNTPLRIIVASMHILASDWARRQGWAVGTYKTVTQPSRLLGLSATTEIHVIDSGVPFQEHTAIENRLKSHFTNVQRHHF